MNTKVIDLIKDQPRVIYLQTTDTTAYALATLDKYGITSAPVIDENKKIHGFLDILDLVNYLLLVIRKSKHSNVTPPSTSLTTDDMGMIAQRSAEFNLAHVEETYDLSRRNPYFPLHEDQTLRDAVEIFLKGPHRIAITDNHNKIVKILTQSNIIQFIANDVSFIGVKASTLASEIMKPVVSVESSDKVVTAFEKMVENNLSSIAVVEGGFLVGTVSASDLKSLKEYRFLKLLLSVSDFLKDVRITQNKEPDYVVQCYENAHLRDVIKRIAHEHVHRIFVTNDKNEPVGVISLTDIIDLCFEFQH